MLPAIPSNTQLNVRPSMTLLWQQARTRGCDYLHKRRPLPSLRLQISQRHVFPRTIASTKQRSQHHTAQWSCERRGSQPNIIPSSSVNPGFQFLSEDRLSWPILRNLPDTLLLNIWILPQLRKWPLPSSSVPVHSSLDLTQPNYVVCDRGDHNVARTRHSWGSRWLRLLRQWTVLLPYGFCLHCLLNCSFWKSSSRAHQLYSLDLLSKLLNKLLINK